MYIHRYIDNVLQAHPGGHHMECLRLVYKYIKTYTYVHVYIYKYIRIEWSWDSSQREDTNLIPQTKVLGEPKLAVCVLQSLLLQTTNSKGVNKQPYSRPLMWPFFTKGRSSCLLWLLVASTSGCFMQLWINKRLLEVSIYIFTHMHIYV